MSIHLQNLWELDRLKEQVFEKYYQNNLMETHYYLTDEINRAHFVTLKALVKNNQYTTELQDYFGYSPADIKQNRCKPVDVSSTIALIKRHL